MFSPICLQPHTKPVLATSWQKCFVVCSMCFEGDKNKQTKWTSHMPCYMAGEGAALCDITKGIWLFSHVECTFRQEGILELILMCFGPLDREIFSPWYWGKD